MADIVIGVIGATITAISVYVESKKTEKIDELNKSVKKLEEKLNEQ